MLANGRSETRVSSNSICFKATPGNGIMAQEPAPLDKLNWLMHVQHIRGEREACKDLIKSQIVLSNGRNEYAFHKQGTILREEGKIQEALDSFQTCLKLNPQNAENLKEVAKCLYDMNRYRLALEAYLEAEKIAKTQDWEIYYYIGYCLMKLGDTVKAKEYAHRTVKIGKQEECYTLLIKILINEGDLQSAVAISNAAIDACPDSVNMLAESGLLYLKLGQTQHAFERLSSALALDQSCAKALLAIGCITQKHEEYEVALTKYKLAILSNPDSVALWNNIGTCFFAKGKYIAAISCLKRALWISPLNWRVLFNLGLVHLAAHQPASAFNFVCAAVNLRPDVAYAFSLLANALVDLNDPENGLRAMKQALHLAPSDPMILCNAAVCHEILGSTDEVPQLLANIHKIVGEGATISSDVIDILEKLAAIVEGRLHNPSAIQEDDNSGVRQSQDLGQDTTSKETDLEDDEMEIAHENGELSKINNDSSNTTRQLEPDEV